MTYNKGIGIAIWMENKIEGIKRFFGFGLDDVDENGFYTYKKDMPKLNKFAQKHGLKFKINQGLIEFDKVLTSEQSNEFLDFMGDRFGDWI